MKEIMHTYGALIISAAILVGILALFLMYHIGLRQHLRIKKFWMIICRILLMTITKMCIFQS